MGEKNKHKTKKLFCIKKIVKIDSAIVGKKEESRKFDS